jgi:hypothetical protein
MELSTAGCCWWYQDLLQRSLFAFFRVAVGFLAEVCLQHGFEKEVGKPET